MEKRLIWGPTWLLIDPTDLLIYSSVCPTWLLIDPTDLLVLFILAINTYIIDLIIETISPLDD